MASRHRIIGAAIIVVGFILFESSLSSYEPATAATTVPAAPRYDKLQSTSSSPAVVPSRRSTREEVRQLNPSSPSPRPAASPKGGSAPTVRGKSWGYASERNVARWEILRPAMRRFVDNATRAPVVVDYGADQGFFSIQSAAIGADVLAVEKGAFGGSFWKKGKINVHTILKKAATEFDVVDRVALCGTEVTPKAFRQLSDLGCTADVQFLLSMLHWVDINGRQHFNEMIGLIVSLARVTYFELPHPLAKNTYGDKRYAGWYERRRNITQVLEEAIRVSGVAARVRDVGGTPWAHLERRVHEVEFLGKVGGRSMGGKQCREVLHCTALRG